MNNLRNVLEDCVNEDLLRIIISNPRKGEKKTKIEVKPFEQKGTILYQCAEYRNNQVFHKNLPPSELSMYCLNQMELYKQIEIWCASKQVSALVNKKGKATIKVQKKTGAVKLSLSHNRKKNYILSDSEPIPFLVELGVQTKEGKVVDKKKKKFKQINRFLEFIRDVEKELPMDRQVTILDFGCGKSYLTFAVYHYLHNIMGRQVKIIGLDLKKDVIAYCNKLSEKFGYEGLKFYHGDISEYEDVDQVDMVMTLHACDVATDYALDKAIRWGAKVILSVPCCQHEVNEQMQSDFLQPIMKYGLLKERMSALITDGIRANLLEMQGYDVQILEFIEMEHTPKNLLIRAVKKKGKKEKSESYQNMCREMHVKTTLERLIEG